MHVEQHEQDRFRIPHDVIVELGTQENTILDVLRAVEAMKIANDSIESYHFRQFAQDTSLVQFIGWPRPYNDTSLEKHLDGGQSQYYKLMTSKLPEIATELLIFCEEQGLPISWVVLTREIEFGHLSWHEDFKALSLERIREIYKLAVPYEKFILNFVGSHARYYQRCNAIFLLRVGIARALEEGFEDKGLDVVLGSAILYVRGSIDHREIKDPITLDSVIQFLQITFSGVGFRRRAWYKFQLPKHAAMLALHPKR